VKGLIEMVSRHSLNRRLALTAMLAPVATSLFAGTVSGVGAQGLTVLRVGAIPIDACGELFYALDRGSFRDAGLDVQLQMFTSGAAIGAAIVGGSLDLGIADLVSASSAHLHGLPFTYIAPAAIYTPQSPGQAILVKKTSPIRAASGFNGKTIAVNAVKTLGQVTAQAWIDRNGGDYKTVTFAEMPFSAMGSALDADIVSGIVITEPAWTLTDGRFRGFELGDTGVANRFLISGYVASKDWASAHPDIVRKFREVIRATGRWANDNRAASAAILSKVSKIAPDVLLRSSRSYYGDALSPELLQPLIDAAVKYGTLAKTFPAAEIIYS
jgi:NitT/TauT family transport system substrate-binding protein